MFGKKLVVSGVAGLIILGAVAGSVSAAPATPTPPGPPAAAQQSGWPGGGFGYGAGFGYQAISGPISTLLGMSADQIRAERLAGKSLAQIAADKGVSKDALVNAMVQSHQSILDARVKAGTLTQAQADAALATMKTRVSQSVDRTEVGPNRPADGQGLGLAFGRGPMGRQLGPQEGTGFGPRGSR
ncbi:MAG: hypothetical protein M1582_01465 [Actinobacteria bacterium]|nr:hypothetical protein [Actinomycetota bacterium]